MAGLTATASPFTHSDTYITHLLANGVDAPTVMEFSGHKSYQSFSVYLHKTDWARSEPA
jgi:site-specific recombinase XerD